MDGNTEDHLKLPKDLFVEIFLRSSVKFLVRAKCVCKHWYALIGTHDFIHNHQQYHQHHNKGRLLLQYFKEDTQELSYALFNDHTLVSDKFHDLDNFQLCRYTIHMEGPINGLYCIFNLQDRIILWNPALMEIRALPLPNTQFFPHDKMYDGLIGFGVDPLSHDYKLVLIRSLLDTDDLYVTVYNLTTNAWKLLDLGDLLKSEYLCESKNSSFLNGVYYWWTSSCSVVSFDMREETFQEISGPDLSHSESSIGSLTMYNDMIAFLHHNGCSIDVCMMLEECVWIKQFSLTSLPSFYWDVGLWKNDQLFVAMDGFETTGINTNFQIALSSAVSQEMRNLGPKGMPITFRASIYYESLVSVACGGEHKAKRGSLNTLSDFLL